MIIPLKHKDSLPTVIQSILKLSEPTDKWQLYFMTDENTELTEIQQL